jgi:hypothetical protein
LTFVTETTKHDDIEIKTMVTNPLTHGKLNMPVIMTAKSESHRPFPDEAQATYPVKIFTSS